MRGCGYGRSLNRLSPATFDAGGARGDAAGDELLPAGVWGARVNPGAAPGNGRAAPAEE